MPTGRLTGPLRRQRVRRWCTETRPVCPERLRTQSKEAELVLQANLRLTVCTTIRKKLRAVRHCCPRRLPAPSPTDDQRGLRGAEVTCRVSRVAVWSSSQASSWRAIASGKKRERNVVSSMPAREAIFMRYIHSIDTINGSGKSLTNGGQEPTLWVIDTFGEPSWTCETEPVQSPLMPLCPSLDLAVFPCYTVLWGLESAAVCRPCPARWSPIWPVPRVAACVRGATHVRKGPSSMKKIRGDIIGDEQEVTCGADHLNTRGSGHSQRSAQQLCVRSPDGGRGHRLQSVPRAP